MGSEVSKTGRVFLVRRVDVGYRIRSFDSSGVRHTGQFAKCGAQPAHRHMCLQGSSTTAGAASRHTTHAVSAVASLTMPTTSPRARRSSSSRATRRARARSRSTSVPRRAQPRARVGRIAFGLHRAVLGRREPRRGLALSLAPCAVGGIHHLDLGPKSVGLGRAQRLGARELGLVVARARSPAARSASRRASSARSRAARRVSSAAGEGVMQPPSPSQPEHRRAGARRSVGEQATDRGVGVARRSLRKDTAQHRSGRARHLLLLPSTPPSSPPSLSTSARSVHTPRGRCRPECSAARRDAAASTASSSTGSSTISTSPSSGDTPPGRQPAAACSACSSAARCSNASSAGRTRRAGRAPLSPPAPSREAAAASTRASAARASPTKPALSGMFARSCASGSLTRTTRPSTPSRASRSRLRVDGGASRDTGKSRMTCPTTVRAPLLLGEDARERERVVGFGVERGVRDVGRLAALKQREVPRPQGRACLASARRAAQRAQPRAAEVVGDRVGRSVLARSRSRATSARSTPTASRARSSWIHTPRTYSSPARSASSSSVAEVVATASRAGSSQSSRRAASASAASSIPTSSSVVLVAEGAAGGARRPRSRRRRRPTA